MGRPLLILHVIDSLANSGGSERQLVRNLRLFSDQRLSHEVVCLYPRPGNDRIAEIPDSVPVSTLAGPGENPGRAQVIHRLSAHVARRHPDLMHCSLANASLAARVVGILRRIPVVESLVNLSYEPIRRADNPAIKRWNFEAYRWMDKLTMVKVTRFHAVSEAVAASWIRHVGLPPDKMRVVPRGLELTTLDAEFERAPSRQELLKSLGLSPDTFLIANSGRQDAQKGQVYALEAMPHILEDVPTAVLAIAGAQGNMTTRLARSVEDLGLQGRVLLLGHRPDAAQLLTAADAFIFPSLFEGMPGALLEAMACRLPCIAFSLPPMDEILSHELTGLLTTPRSPSGLADAVIRLATDSQLRHRLGDAARASVETKYRAENAAAALEQIYLEVLEGMWSSPAPSD